MRTSNPALRADVFRREHYTGTAMTIEGTVHKTLLLLAVMFLPAAFIWHNLSNPIILPLMILGLVGGLVCAIILIFKHDWSPYLVPLYAICEGLVLGGISAIFEQMYPGIVLQAVALTFGTLFCLLLIYRAGWIKATENFRLGLFAATGAIALIYLITLVLNLFGTTIPYIHEAGWIGIAFSLIVVVVAALNLVLDFDFIEEGAKQKAPAYMEWYAAFGLLVTLVWLYIEILRLLSKMRRD